jgi:hypothetical protein
VERAGARTVISVDDDGRVFRGERERPVRAVHAAWKAAVDAKWWSRARPRYREERCGVHGGDPHLGLALGRRESVDQQ